MSEKSNLQGQLRTAKAAARQHGAQIQKLLKQRNKATDRNVRARLAAEIDIVQSKLTEANNLIVQAEARLKEIAAAERRGGNGRRR